MAHARAVSTEAPVGPTGRGELRAIAALGALGLFVALEVAYVLRFSPFWTADAATHLGSAAALTDSLHGSDLTERFLQWNPWPAPNMSTILALAPLIALFGVEWAEKVVLVGYIVVLPLAAVYAVRGAGMRSELLAFFVLPVTFSMPFMYGFLNFSYSVATFLLVAGFVIRTDERASAARTAGLSGLLLLAFFTHFVGFLAASLFVIVVIGVRGLSASGGERRSIFTQGLALLPPTLITLIFLASSGSAGVTSWSPPRIERLVGLLTLKTGIVAYEDAEVFFCQMFAFALAALVAVAVIRNRAWRDRDPTSVALGIFTIAIAAIAMLAPNAVGSGGSFLVERLALFPVLGVMLWLARQRLPTILLALGAIMAVVSAVGLTEARASALGDLERRAQEMRALASCVQDGSTIVQGNLAEVRFGDASRIAALTAEAGRLAAARNGLDLGNVDWDVPFWIQRFRPAVNPYDHLVMPGANPEDVPPPLDFDGFQSAAGAIPDYVLLWGAPAMSQAERAAASWRRFDAALSERYTLVASSPGGWWTLWTSTGSQCSRVAG